MDISYFVWPFPNHNSKWVISRLGLSWIKLLWTFMYRFLCKQKFLALRDKCPTMPFLSHMVSSCLIFFLRNCQTIFQSVVDISVVSIWMIKFPHILDSIWYRGLSYFGFAQLLESVELNALNLESFQLLFPWIVFQFHSHSSLLTRF